jgi:hypothetical protein
VQVVEHGQPELGALGLLPPQAQDLSVALDGDADRQIAGASAHAAVLADADHQRVEVDDRIHLLKRPRAPRGDILEHGVSDSRDGVAADLDAIEIAQVRSDVAHRHAAGVEPEHPLVQAGQTRLALRDQLGSKLPLRSRGVLTCTAPSSVCTVFGLDPLRTLPVPPGGACPGG